MRKLNLKSASTVLIAVLALTLILTTAFAVGGDVARADDTPSGTKIGEFSVAHTSDIHYFPLDYCYQDITAEDFKTSDFYQSTTVDTKLVIESGNILYANVMRMLNMAKKSTLPLYVFATGDLTKNGERVAHRDVANSLRYLQNEVRKLGGKYANFQVFATVGNHDLYNGSGALYDKETGVKYGVAEGVTTAQWALIYNGLGYPSVDKSVLYEIYPEEYWSSSFTSGYQPSTIAENLTLHYINDSFQEAHDANRAGTPLTAEELHAKYLEIGDGFSQLSVNVEIANSSYKLIIADATLREKTEELVPVRVNPADYEYYKNGDYTFHLTKLDEHSNPTVTILEESATESEILAAFAAGHPVYRNSGYSHLCGGTLRPELLDFIADFTKNTTTTDGVNEATFIACFHQNLLPHFEVEDDILKDFTFYNWEYIAKLFAELGVRYSLSGHQHSSDVMSYTDAEGRTVYDMQTGSFVSLDSPVRVFTVERYNCDGVLAEKADSSLYLLDSAGPTPLKGTPSNHVYTTAPWNEDAYQQAMTAYNNATDKEAAWADVIAANPNYLTYTIKHDDFDSLSYNEYIVQEVYSQLIERVLSHFLDEDFLLGTLDGLFDGFLGPDSPSLKLAGFVNLDPYKPMLYKMVNQLVDTVWSGLYEDKDGNGYGDYEFDGEVFDNLLGCLKAVVDSVTGLEFGDKDLGTMTLAEMAVYIFTSACSGNEVSSNLELPEGVYDENGPYFTANTPYDNAYRLRFQAAIKDLAAQGDSGELIERLLYALLNPLYLEEDSLLRTLFTYKFDFTKATGEYAFTKDDIDSFNKLIGALEIFGIQATANNFVLVDIVNGALPILGPMIGDLLGFELNTNDILGFLDGFLEDYLVESFFVGLGGIAKYIVVSYGSDDTPDLADITDPTKPLTLAPYSGFAKLSVGGNETNVSYISGKANDLNPASTVNGRLPGSLTANFDTVNGDDTFVFSYYTAEEVFAKVEYRKVGESNWTTLTGEHWNIFDEADRCAHLNAYNNLYAKVTSGDATVETLTAPQYIPLIDLGLLCITHGATYYKNEEGEEVYYTAVDRFNAPTNSVLLWNKHTVTISGLDKDTEYEYRIYGVYYNTDGEEVNEYFYTNEDGDATTFSFKTAKTEGDFEFLAVSDPQGMIQSMYDETAEVFDTINANSAVSGYDFIVNAGDMVDNGKNFYQWQYALNTMLDTYANTSLFSVAGNHEAGSFALDKFFNYTQPSTVEENAYGEALQDYYSFDYGDGHFIFLDTNDATAKGLGKKQLNWLENDLEKTDKDFVFVIMHKSLFSTGAHANDAEVVKMRDQLVPLFDEYGVDMVFGGHDHVYAETYPIGESGTVYVTLGTIGTKFYEYTNDNEDVSDELDYDKTFEHTLTEQTVGYVKVVDGVLYYNGYTIGALKAMNAFAESHISSGIDVSVAEIKMMELPEGYTIQAVYGGKTYSLDELNVKGKDKTVSLYAVDAHGHSFYLGDVSVVETGLGTAGVAIIAVVCALVGVGAIVGPIVMAKRKKKASTPAPETVADGADDTQE